MLKKTFLILCVSAQLFGATEIVFWHSFEGFLYDKFAEVVDDFNHSSESYQVKLIYKGNYADAYKSGVKAFAEGNAPHILQVSEFATQTMMLSPEMFVPVDDLMRKYYKKFDPDIYINAVREFYSTADRKLCSFPWNASTGVLFYNKKVFEAAGLDPETPPKTWEEMEAFGKKLVDAGYIGFTTAWPAAYHLEHICSWHDLPFATEQNGFGGLGARLNFNGEYQIRHWEKLAAWEKQGIFSYQGRFTEKPEAMFTEGRCGILLQGANRYPMLRKGLSVGVGFIPYWSDIANAPNRLNIGGTSFWVISGFNDEIYRGIFQFFSFLSQTEIQAHWHQQTGYLPITEAAYLLAKKRGFYNNNSAAEIAVMEVMNSKVTPNTKGIRLGNYPLVREMIISNLEKALQGELLPKEALDRSVEEGNAILSKFEKEHTKN